MRQCFRNKTGLSRKQPRSKYGESPCFFENYVVSAEKLCFFSKNHLTIVKNGLYYVNNNERV